MKTTTTTIAVIDRMSHYSYETSGPQSDERVAERSLRGWIHAHTNDIMKFLRGFGEATVCIFRDDTGEVMSEIDVVANFGTINYK